MDEPAKTLGDTTSKEHDCVRELWWAATGCYFSEDSLDKAEKASIAFLESRNLRVIDPAKCMVLERREGVPKEEGEYLVIHETKYIGPFVANNDGFRSHLKHTWFGPIQLPPTEGR